MSQENQTNSLEPKNSADLSEFSQIGHGTPGDKYRALYESLSDKSGWDRLKILFTTNEWGQRHPDLEYAINGTFASGITGLVIGGYIGASVSLDEFVQKNKATKFHNEIEAKRHLHDHVMFGSIKHALKWSWRLSLFMGTFLFSSAALTNYRNKTNVLDYTGAGFIAGSLYQFKSRPRTILLGGITGATLGTIAGLAMQALFWVTGMSLEEANFWRMEYQIQSENERHERLLKQRKKEAFLMHAPDDQS